MPSCEQRGTGGEHVGRRVKIAVASTACKARAAGATTPRGASISPARGSALPRAASPRGQSPRWLTPQSGASRAQGPSRRPSHSSDPADDTRRSGCRVRPPAAPARRVVRPARQVILRRNPDAARFEGDGLGHPTLPGCGRLAAKRGRRSIIARPPRRRIGRPESNRRNARKDLPSRVAYGKVRGRSSVAFRGRGARAASPPGRAPGVDAVGPRGTPSNSAVTINLIFHLRRFWI